MMGKSLVLAWQCNLMLMLKGDNLCAVLGVEQGWSCGRPMGGWGVLTCVPRSSTTLPTLSPYLIPWWG